MPAPPAIHHTTAPTVLHTLITLTCPTTGRAYTVDDALIAMIGDHTLMWSRCAWCDALGNRSGDGCSPAGTPPQVHDQLLRF